MFDSLLAAGGFVPDTIPKLALITFGITQFIKQRVPEEKRSLWIPYVSIVVSLGLSSIYLTLMDGLIVGLVLTESFAGIKELLKTFGNK